MTALLGLTLHTSVREISALIGKNSGELSGSLLPIHPTDFLNLRPTQFQALIYTHLSRLQKAFGQDIFQKLCKDYETLVADLAGDARRTQRQIKLLEQKIGFSKAWESIGDKVPFLRALACGFATVFPTTAQVESDFSRIKFARCCWRTSLADLTLEGTLYSKQLDLIFELLNTI